jgi:hypothetical protein
VNFGPLSKILPQAAPEEDVVITREDVDRAHDRVRVSAARPAGFLLQVSPAVAVRRTQNSGDAWRERRPKYDFLRRDGRKVWNRGLNSQCDLVSEAKNDNSD